MKVRKGTGIFWQVALLELQDTVKTMHLTSTKLVSLFFSSTFWNLQVP